MTGTSPSAPGARRFLVIRIAVVAATTAIGLALQPLLRSELAAIQKLAETDVLAARAQLAAWLRIGGVALFGLTAAVGVSMLVSSRRAYVEERFPPSGVWAWGASRIVTGTDAKRMASLGLVLGALLVSCSAVAGVLCWFIAATLLACRAI
jgi:hypothetical protein